MVFFGVAGAAPLTVIIGSISAIYAIIVNTALPVVYLSSPRSCPSSRSASWR